MGAELFDAAVLAGGQSRRFGADKTRLPAEMPKEDLAARNARILREAGFRKVWLCCGTLERARNFPGVTDLPDDILDLGPAGGLQAVLSRAEKGVLLVAADMPNYSRELAEWVVSRWDGRALAAAPCLIVGATERWEPLCALYLKEAQPVLERRLANQRRDMHGLLDELGAQKLSVPQELANGLLNINTREDWERYKNG